MTGSKVKTRVYMTTENVSADLNDGQLSQPAAVESQEKMVPQSQVDKIVKAVEQRGHEKGYERAKQELGQYSAGAYQPNPQIDAMNMPQQQGMNMAPQSDEQVMRVVNNMVQHHQQALQQKQLQTETEKILSNYKSSEDKARADYPDYDEVMKKVNLGAFPHAMILANQLGSDKAAHMMYEMVQNPHKLLEVEGLAKNQNENLAQERLLGLKGSIEQNLAAKNAAAPNEPLSQMKPSTIGVDNGSVSISDMRNNPLYRY